MVVAFLCMGGKRFNGKCMKPFSHCTEEKIGIVEFQREVFMTIMVFFGRNKSAKSLVFLWCFQAMWSLIPRIISLWNAHQNIDAVNTVVVDQSIYARNAMLPYNLTVSRTIIHETQNLLYCFLTEC